MTRPVSGAIPNLINGISQQAPALRLATQGEFQDNYYSTIVEGLKDRPPTEFIAKILDTLPDGCFTHIINRDKVEQYVLVIDPTSNQIKVFDFDGVEHEVNAPEGWAYLSGLSDPASQIRALTVADYTFVTNTTKTVEMDDAYAPKRKHEAIVNVLAGNYGKTYRIYINDTLVASHTTPVGDSASQAPYVDTVYIASQLDAALQASGYNSGGWHSDRYQNAIHIYHELEDDAHNFTIKVEDGYNGNAMKATKDRTQRFSDLPPFGPDGFVAEIVGDGGSAADNYWVKFETGTSGPGIWRETVKPGVQLFLHSATMPHVLIREADGTFTFDEAEWDKRKCGDDEQSPDPSFVGNTIQDVYFHRNRLGFLSDENAILSRNGSFFDFFRTSVTALLDDDPIDVGASHVKVSLLKAAVPYQDELVLFSEQTQFTLQGNDMLTPKTVSARPRTEYVCDGSVRPIGLGTSVFFTANRGEYQSVWEYVIDKASQTAVANEVTSHAPAYVPSDVFKIIGTSNENVLIALSRKEPNRLYLYKYYFSGEEKLQAAWQHWTLPGECSILNAEFVRSDLYLVVRREDGVYLEKMRFQPNATDEGMEFIVHLDQRVHSDKIAAPVYDDELDTTTYTLPYQTSPKLIAVTSPGGATVSGRALSVVGRNAIAKTVTLAGDTRAFKAWFGVPYERRYRFSRFYLRTPSGGGGTTTVQSGRLQLKQMTLSHDKSSYFRVEVTPVGRQTYTYLFTGRSLGSADNVLGSIPLISGKMTVPILSRNDRVVIEIINDSWMPSAFINVEWTGTHNEKAREL